MTALIISIAFTLGVSAFCSLLEAFVLSISSAEIESMKKTNPRRGARLQHYKETLEETSSAILTLNTVANTLGANLVGYFAGQVFGSAMVGVIAGLLTLGILIFSEILPKNLGVIYRNSLRLRLVGPIGIVRFITWPVSRLTLNSMRFFVDHEKIAKDTNEEEEIRLLAEKHANDGVLTRDESKIIANALSLDAVHVSDLMTPRTVMSALDRDRTVLEVFEEHKKNIPFARMPVYDDTVDNIVGIVRRRDLLTAHAEDKESSRVDAFMGDAIFIPDSATLHHALQQFLKSHQQLAVVVDEYGSVVGVLSVEDIMEHLIGREIYEDTDIAVDMRKLAMDKARITTDSDASDPQSEKSLVESMRPDSKSARKDDKSEVPGKKPRPGQKVSV